VINDLIKIRFNGICSAKRIIKFWKTSLKSLQLLPAPTQNQSTTSTTTANTVIQQPPASTHNQSTASTHTTCSQPPFTQTTATHDSTIAQTSAKSKSQANKKQGASKTNSAATTQTASKTPGVASKTKATATKKAATNVAASNKRGPNTTRQKLPFKRGQTSATQPPSKWRICHVIN